jgi:hypothetical protein
LGLLGGGYAERAWFKAEGAKVTRPDVGCGFITWALARLSLVRQNQFVGETRAAAERT